MERACKHVQAASRLLSLGSGSGKATPLVRSLVKAISCRALPGYAEAIRTAGKDDRAAVASALLGRSNRAYAVAMRGVYKAHPRNPDVAALFAEALMNLAPWRLWPHSVPTTLTGAHTTVTTTKNHPSPLAHVVASLSESHPFTAEALAVLEAVKEVHPGVAHFYVHLIEMAPDPHTVARALPYCRQLRSQWPACGHLLHMASHIYSQLGMYEDAIAVNQSALAQDRCFARLRGSDNYYHGYRVHTHHALVWSAMLAGQYATALHTAEVTAY